jgi:F-type H+-transporting ATPase subunit gamma
MAKTRELVKRRKAIRNIRKITRTMELIATARFKKAMDRATQASAYTKRIAEMVRDLSATAANVSHPLLEVHDPVQKSLLLVLGSNRGLCGGYNAGILREANKRIAEIREAGIELQLELSGKRPINYYKFQRIPAQRTYIQFEDKPAFDQVKEIADRYIQMYISGAIDRIDVAYMKFESASRQYPTVETLLPLSAPAEQTAPAAVQTAAPVEYEFLPGARDILEALLPVTFRIRLFKCFLDAAVSEQIARRVTMSQATENADEMIKDLTSKYNRARQAQITKEIAEVIGGAAALQ